MAKSRKTGIRLSIEKLLIPALAERGFKCVPDAPNEHDARSNPWGRFLRRDPGGMAIIEIEFHKNHLAHFRLNLALATGETASSIGTPIALEEQRTAHVNPNYYLTRWGLPLRRWFGVRKLAREGITDGEYDAAAMKAVNCLPEVDRLFATGKRSWRMAEMPEPGWVGWMLIGFWGFVAFVLLVAAFLAWTALVGLVVRLFR